MASNSTSSTNCVLVLNFNFHKGKHDVSSFIIKNPHPHVISSSILPVLPEPLHVSAPRLLSTRRAPLHWAPRHQPAVGPSTPRTRRPPPWLVAAARCPAGSVWPWVSAQGPPAAVQTIYTRRYLKLMDLVGLFSFCFFLDGLCVETQGHTFWVIKENTYKVRNIYKDLECSMKMNMNEVKDTLK